MSKLWIKFKTNNAVKVSTEECQDVDDFLKQLESYSCWSGKLPPSTELEFFVEQLRYSKVMKVEVNQYER